MQDLDKNLPDDIKGDLRQFITEKFFFSSEVNSLEDTDSFMEKGIIDSTGVLELLEFVEDKFKIRVEDEEIIPDNLDSLNNLASFIKRKTENVSQ